jgi:hypothetical protein
LQRGLFDRPLTVQWTWSPRGLSGPTSEAVGDRRSPRFTPLPGLSRVTSRQLARGDLNRLFTVYGGLDSGRMILVGTPGAGKTGAMIRLLLDAVKHRKGIREAEVRATVPVPVLLTAYDWLPEHEELAAWVARRLQDEHSFLKAKVGPVSAARALVDAGAISILIDGVDEMPTEARAAVLRQIGAQAGHRIVLSSRTDELVQAVARGHLDGAAALELAAVTAEQAADYLRSRTVHPTPARWRTVIQHLRDHEASAVAHALDSPLMLSLLLDTYLPLDPVDELTDLERFPGRHQIEDHLLARVLPTAYAPRAGTTAPLYTPQQARRWLGFLAAQMNEAGTRDLAWWRISQWLPSRKLKLAVGLMFGPGAGLVAGLLLALAFGLAFGPTTGLTAGPVIGLTVALTAGLRSGLTVGLAPGPGVGSAVGLEFGIPVGLTAGRVYDIEYGLATGLTVGLEVAITVAVTIGLTIGLTSRLTSGLGTTVYDGFPPQYRGLKRRNRLLIGDIATGLAAGLIIGLVIGLAGGLAFGLRAGLVAGPTVGLAAGFSTGPTAGLTQALSASLPADKLLTPVDSWQGNSRLVLALGLGVGLASGLAVGVVGGVTVGLTTSGSVAGIVIGVAGGLAVGLAGGLAGASTNINFISPGSAAFILLRRGGRGPARMMDFLEDARKRGVLRTAGPTYQFRHARLQDLLADTTR